MTYTQNHLEWSMSIITQIFMPMNWTILLMMKLVLLQNPFIMAEGKSPKKQILLDIGKFLSMHEKRQIQINASLNLMLTLVNK